MQKSPKNKKTGILSKIWKSLVALGVVMGIINPGIKLDITTIALLVVAVIALAVY